MKLAVSIPDELAARADKVSSDLGLSRSAFYQRALSALLREISESKTTAAYNAVIDQIDSPTDNFLREAARRTLERSEW